MDAYTVLENHRARHRDYIRVREQAHLASIAKSDNKQKRKVHLLQLLLMVQR